MFWLFSDHLGSTTSTVNGTSEAGEVRYKAFGANRFTSGLTPTSYRYTGQREEAGLGLYYYGARWYDPALGHFLQPDTIVPDAGNVLDYHRYGYARFNPLKYNDPTGHEPCTICLIPNPLYLLQTLWMAKEAGVDNPLAPAYLVPVAMGTYQKSAKQMVVNPQRQL